MASKSKREPVCQLFSEYSGAPGLSWTTNIEFRHSRNTVQAKISCEGIEQKKSFSDALSPWRAIAAFLANNVDGWGTPWGAGVQADAPAILPYQQNIILLCWLRFEGEELSHWGNVALSLPDAWLEEAHSRYGKLTIDLDAIGRLNYSLGWGEQMSEEEDDDDDDDEGRRSLDGETLAVEVPSPAVDPSWEHDLCLLQLAIEGNDISVLKLASTLGTHDSPRPYAETTALLRERSLSFVSMAEEIASQIESRLPPPKSWIESMGHSTKIGTRVRCCHRQFLLTGSLSESDVGT